MNQKCPNNCNTSDLSYPFYYSSVCTGDEEGVFADKEGNPTNTWSDGTRGVSQEVLDNLETHDYTCLHCTVCGEEVETIIKSQKGEIKNDNL